ncbi:adenosine deaminase 2-A isoform X2 [Hippocampus zosterae]|uniref:adenosine deaminase 2-A isoform X2 n=1 Tax=Hippocampus zosterae TaxID=109293 RepID=UPI00223CADC1|nr:adenosine deaminase 2-A isoform X2 [Hippocampus zosterae]
MPVVARTGASTHPATLSMHARLVNHMVFVRQKYVNNSVTPSVVLTCLAGKEQAQSCGKTAECAHHFFEQRPRVASKDMTASLPRAVTLLCLSAAVLGMPNPSQRDLLMRLEVSKQMGGDAALTPAELRLDGRLQRLKEREMAAEPFPPAVHFFKARSLIRDSPVFKLLQEMPKGGALHIHSTSLASAEWLVKNVTYRPHCYICFAWDNSPRFVFSQRRPYPRWDCFYWQLLSTLRAKASDLDAFDQSLMRHFTLVTDDPDAEYPDQNAAWNKFENAFIASAGLVSHAPVLRDSLLQGLHELHQDNVMYLELRNGLSKTYELDGTVHDKIWTLKTFQDVTKQFVADHPDFLGARLIIAVHRSSSASEVKAAVKEAVALQKDFPDVVAGFDLVGREDTGSPLWYFRDALELPAQLGVNLPYFFHAGETDSEGTEADQNMMDALLFNTSRIGHGYALARHPLAKEMSRQRKVAVEVCPISNQVLKLVSDLRNHPAAVLMSEGHPMVISSDDPSMFGTSGLSYDFYQAYVGLGGMKANVGTLKELARNSLRYSSLPAPLKDAGLAAWQRKWDAFVSAHS